MNTLDFVILGIILVSALIGFKSGLIYTLFKLLSLIIALILTMTLYPVVSRFLRESPLFEFLRGRISTATNFEAVFRENVPNPEIPEAVRESEIINSMPLPQFLRDMLYYNNTPDMYEVLGVAAVEEYITSTLANIVINVISILVVLLMVLLVLHFIGKLLRIIDYIPVIATFNNFGGLVAGALIGVGVIWLGLSVITMLLSVGGNETLAGLLEYSTLAGFFFDTGWLMERITAV